LVGGPRRMAEEAAEQRDRCTWVGGEARKGGILSAQQKIIRGVYSQCASVASWQLGSGPSMCVFEPHGCTHANRGRLACMPRSHSKHRKSQPSRSQSPCLMQLEWTTDDQTFGMPQMQIAELICQKVSDPVPSTCCAELIPFLMHL